MSLGDTLEGLLTISVGPSNGTVGVQEVTFFDAIQATFNFDTGDQVVFTIPAFSPEASFIDEMASDIFLEGIVRQRYRVITVDQGWDEDGGDNISVTAVSYKRLLASRGLRTALDFVAVDQGDILWALVAHTQAQPGGNWGITHGSTTTGQLRERHYVIGENIGDLAAKISRVIDGCWYNVDADRVFTAAMPSSFPTQATPLQLGVTARKLNRKSAASQFGNAVMASGSDQQTTPVWAEAGDIASDPRGRWEKTISSPSTITQATLVEQATGALQSSINPPATWTAQLEPARWITDARYIPGDFVVAQFPPTIAAPIGAAAQRATLQITELSANYTNDGALTLTISAVETVTSDPTARVGRARVGSARVGHA